MHLIDRFGVEAVTGRKVLCFGEVRRMIAAENIAVAFKSRKEAKQAGIEWAQWGQANPDLEKLLIEVEVLNATG